MVKTKKFLKVPLFTKNPGNAGGFFTKDYFPLNIIILAILGGGIGLLIWFLTKPKPPQCDKISDVCGDKCCTDDETCCENACYAKKIYTCPGGKLCLRTRTTDDHLVCCRDDKKPLPSKHTCHGCTAGTCPSSKTPNATRICSFSPNNSDKYFKSLPPITCTNDTNCIVTPTDIKDTDFPVCCPDFLLGSENQCCIGKDLQKCGDKLSGNQCCNNTAGQMCCTNQPKTSSSPPGYTQKSECCEPGQKCINGDCMNICNIDCNIFNDSSCPPKKGGGGYSTSCCPSGEPNTHHDGTGCLNCCGKNQSCLITKGVPGSSPPTAKCDFPGCEIEGALFTPPFQAINLLPRGANKILPIQPLRCTGGDSGANLGDCAMDANDRLIFSSRPELMGLCFNPQTNFAKGGDQQLELIEQAPLNPISGSCSPRDCINFMDTNAGQGRKGMNWGVVAAAGMVSVNNPAWDAEMIAMQVPEIDLENFIKPFIDSESPPVAPTVQNLCKAAKTRTLVDGINNKWLEYANQQNYQPNKQVKPCVITNEVCYGKGLIQPASLVPCPSVLPVQKGDAKGLKNQACDPNNWQYSYFAGTKNPNPTFSGYLCSEGAEDAATFCSVGGGVQLPTDGQGTINCYNGFIAEYQHTNWENQPMKPSIFYPWYLVNPTPSEPFSIAGPGMQLDGDTTLYMLGGTDTPVGSAISAVAYSKFLASTAKVFIPWNAGWGDLTTTTGPEAVYLRGQLIPPIAIPKFKPPGPPKFSQFDKRPWNIMDPFHPTLGFQKDACKYQVMDQAIPSSTNVFYENVPGLFKYESPDGLWNVGFEMDKDNNASCTDDADPGLYSPYLSNGRAQGPNDDYVMEFTHAGLIQGLIRTSCDGVEGCVLPSQKMDARMMQPTDNPGPAMIWCTDKTKLVENALVATGESTCSIRNASGTFDNVPMPPAGINKFPAFNTKNHGQDGGDGRGFFLSRLNAIAGNKGNACLCNSKSFQDHPMSNTCCNDYALPLKDATGNIVMIMPAAKNF